MIQICTFKEKENKRIEGKPQLGGQWKVPMLGGLWKEKEKGNYAVVLFSFSPQQILFKPFFSLILSFYFTMVLDCYFMAFLPFL
jgi:hypothetical protein